MTRLSTNSQTKTKPKIIFVIGLGRSGSTLLGRLLNNHPSVVDMGELLRLDSTLDEPSSKCACGLPLIECSDWNHLLKGIPEKVKRDYRKWTPSLLHQVRENAKADVLLDVSKTRAYRLAQKWRDPEIGFILLLRDPRGILRSHVANGKELEKKLKLQQKWMKRYQKFAAKNSERCHLMFYEDLVSKPEEELTQLCDFIGLDYIPEMITPRSEECHMALYSTSPYMKDTGKLRLDERWRDELAPSVIARISEALAPLELYEKRYQLSKDC